MDMYSPPTLFRLLAGREKGWENMYACNVCDFRNAYKIYEIDPTSNANSVRYYPVVWKRPLDMLQSNRTCSYDTIVIIRDQISEFV